MPSLLFIQQSGEIGQLHIRFIFPKWNNLNVKVYVCVTTITDFVTHGTI